jgi:hypothetical protein
VAGKKAAEVAGKIGANRVLVKVEGKVAEGSAMIWTPSVEASSRTLSPGALGREFHSDLARFLRAALAPFLPRAVRVFFDKCAIVFFRRAALAAFLIFRLVAARCFLDVNFT